MYILFGTTPRILMGPGAITSIGEEMQNRGISRVMIVTDKGVVKAGLLAILEQQLVKSKISYNIFNSVQPDPSYMTVAECVRSIKNDKSELVIGFGGGSSIDIAKTAAVVSRNDDQIEKYFGVNLIPRAGLPTIVIPTTAGTGSEVTPIAILSDEKEKLKKGVVSPYLYPSVAIVDPELTLTLPPEITAATGMDALIHAVEAYTSVNACGLTDMYCVRAVELIYNNLRTAFARGREIKARSAMMEGALLAGIGFANAGVTAVHAFAYPIGAEYHIPHGVANAIMFSHVIRFNSLGCIDKLARLARYFQIPVINLNKYEITERVINAIERLVEDIRVPRHLSEYGVKESDIAELASGVMKIERLLNNNPRTVTQEDAVEIYKAAL